MDDADIIGELLLEGLDDWVPLHDVVWRATQGQINPDSKAQVLRILEVLYEKNLMVPGVIGGSGFEDWPISPVDYLGHSRDELDRLDWRPMGDGFWLRLTERGEGHARGHGRSGAN